MGSPDKGSLIMYQLLVFYRARGVFIGKFL